jgi:glycosyltransferase involved in cell wall biosynthesis
MVVELLNYQSNYTGMKVLFASHTYMGGPYVVGSHHLAREMGRLGIQVLHVSTPITPGHAMSYKKQTSRERLKIWRHPDKREENVMNYVPFSLFHWRMVNRIYRSTGTNWFVKGTIFPTFSTLLDKYGFSEVDLLLIDQPLFAGINQYVKAKKTIYRATDLNPEMMGDEIVAKAEEKIISHSDALIATSEPVLNSIRRYNNELPALLMHNGVDYEHFNRSYDEPQDLAVLTGQKAIYVGALDHRFDVGAVTFLAQSLPRLQIILIGPHSSELVDRTSSLPNIHVLGPRNYNDIPAYLQHSDVGLLPLSSHKANQGRSPMKLYEYAASGLPVVVRETVELQRRKEPFLYFYNIKDEFVQSTLDALHNKNDISKEQTRFYAKKQSWASKTRELLDFCEISKSEVTSC